VSLSEGVSERVRERERGEEERMNLLERILNGRAVRLREVSLGELYGHGGLADAHEPQHGDLRRSSSLSLSFQSHPSSLPLPLSFSPSLPLSPWLSQTPQRAGEVLSLEGVIAAGAQQAAARAANITILAEHAHTRTRTSPRSSAETLR
jgi:hypothetical protein